MSNRIEQVRKIQLKAAIDAGELAKKKRDAVARNVEMLGETVVYKKTGKCKCRKHQH